MGCRWVDGRLFGKGWEKWEGVVRKKVACQIPTSQWHRTTHSSDQAKTQRVVHPRYPGGLWQTGAKQQRQSGGRLRHTCRQALTNFTVGPRGRLGQWDATVAQPPNFAKRIGFAGQSERGAVGIAVWPSTTEFAAGLCSASSGQQQQRSELAPTASRPLPTTHHRARQTTTARADEKKILIFARPRQPRNPPAQPTPNRQRRISSDDTYPPISSSRFIQLCPACLTTERSRSRPSLATRSCPRMSSRRLAASSCSTSGPTRMSRSATSP